MYGRKLVVLALGGWDQHDGVSDDMGVVDFHSKQENDRAITDPQRGTEQSPC